MPPRRCAIMERTLESLQKEPMGHSASTHSESPQAPAQASPVHPCAGQSRPGAESRRSPYEHQVGGKMEYKVISADNHLIEPRDLFTKGLPAKFKERAPRVVRAEDGGDGWTWDGKNPKRTFGIEAVAGRVSRS